MEPCNRVNEWLEQDSPPDVTKIPTPLNEHMKNCQVCRKTLEYFQNIAQAQNQPCLSSHEVAEFMKEFQTRAAVSQVFPSFIRERRQPMKHIPLSLAFAGAVLILVLSVWSAHIIQTPNSPKKTVQSFAVLMGKAMIVSDDGKETPATISGHDILRVTMIKFDSSAEPVSVKYPNGGSVTLSGTGRLKILKDGLDVKSGAFNARFKNLVGIHTVRVPCAVLGIRGTEIRFDIQPTRSEIAIVEGAVDLIPDDTAQKTIRLEKGKMVLLEGNAWVTPSQLPPRPSPGSTQNDIHRENIASRPMTPPTPVAPGSSAAEAETGANAPEEDIATDSEDVSPGSMIETGEDTASQGSDGFGGQGSPVNP